MIIDAPTLLEATRWKKRQEAAFGSKVGILLIDLTKTMLDGAKNLGQQAATIEAFIALAKRVGLPVVEVVPTKEPTIKAVADLLTGCKKIRKEGTDAFWCTDLAAHLREVGLGTLVVAGAYTGQCVASTVQSLAARSLGIQFMSCPEILIAASEETDAAVQTPIWCNDSHVRYYRRFRER